MSDSFGSSPIPPHGWQAECVRLRSELHTLGERHSALAARSLNFETQLHSATQSALTLEKKCDQLLAERDTERADSVRRESDLASRVRELEHDVVHARESRDRDVSTLMDRVKEICIERDHSLKIAADADAECEKRIKERLDTLRANLEPAEDLPLFTIRRFIAGPSASGLVACLRDIQVALAEKIPEWRFVSMVVACDPLLDFGTGEDRYFVSDTASRVALVRLALGVIEQAVANDRDIATDAEYSNAASLVLSSPAIREIFGAD